MRDTHKVKWSDLMTPHPAAIMDGHKDGHDRTPQGGSKVASPLCFLKPHHLPHRWDRNAGQYTTHHQVKPLEISFILHD